MGEQYKSVFLSDDPVIIKNNAPAKFEFDFEKKENQRHRLFFKAESALFYMWKSESDSMSMYLSIDDSLNKEKSKLDVWCLDYSSKDKVLYGKTAYKKITWPPVLSYLSTYGYYTNKFKWGIHACAKGLEIEKDGSVYFSMEVFYKKQDDDSVTLVPDERYVIEIDGGSYDYKKYESQVELDYDKVSHVDFILYAEGYSGELYFERPFLEGEKLLNLLPDFAPILPSHEKFAWIGINLSKREWPQFNIKLNRKTVFDGELFEKCHRFSDFEIPLPDKAVKKGKNTLEIAVKKEYDFPMRLIEAGIFSKQGKNICIEGCPHTVYVGKTAKVLITTYKDKQTVKFKSKSDKIRANPQKFEKAGLNVFEIEVLKSGVDIEFTLGGEKAVFEIAIEKKQDGIITGTGDIIYINHQSQDHMDSYLAWYMGSAIGNLFTIRNVYRWGGGRRLEPDVWKKTSELLNRLDMKYAHMMDGRDLPGAYCNPSEEMLEGSGFLGRQRHEFDGQYGYWGTEDVSHETLKVACEELWARVSRKNWDIAEFRHNNTTLLHDNDRVYLFKKPVSADNMKDARDKFVNSVGQMNFGAIRHTGPSTWFKYFYQAGYKWTGAELMYSSFDILSSALRGAATGYQQNQFGAHHAVQWSTTPHDDIYRFRRFRLALYASYLNGYTEINTEEGFWHIEEYYTSYSRNSNACLSHLKQQQDFYRYICLNRRRGEYQTPFAFVSGRYDGWNAWYPDAVWGQNSFNPCDCENSWSLINEFYPQAMLNCSYKHPCPVESVGYYSGSPYGNVDITPIETHNFSKYKVLCFAGYNKMQDDDCDALMEFMKNGGRVIMGQCHLTTTLNRQDIENGNLEFIQNDFTRLIEQNRNQQPVITIKIGQGELTFIDSPKYPANPEVNHLYRQAIANYRDQIQDQQKIKVECGNNMQYMVYQDQDISDIYLLAVDWYAQQYDRIVKINTVEVAVPFGTMIKVVMRGDVMAYTDCENAVVSDIEGNRITVCGHGQCNVIVVKDSQVSHRRIEFTDDSTVTIEC